MVSMQTHFLIGWTAVNGLRESETRRSAGGAGCGSASCLVARLETLDAVRDLRSVVSLVRELCHRQGERLEISGDSQWSSVHGFETNITNQSRRGLFRVLGVATVHEARPAASPSLLLGEDLKQHLARDRAEGGDDVGFSKLLREHLGTRRCVGDGEGGIVG